MQMYLIKCLIKLNFIIQLLDIEVSTFLSTSLVGVKMKRSAENFSSADADGSYKRPRYESEPSIHSSSLANYVEQSVELVDQNPELVLSKGIVRRIVKLDKEVKMVSLDAIFLIAKAAETFISEFSKESMEFSDVRYQTRNAEKGGNGDSSSSTTTTSSSSSSIINEQNNTNSISTPTPDISSTTSGSDTSTDLATNIHKITPHNTNQRNTSTRDEQWLRYDDVYNALQVQKDRGKDWSFLDRLLSSPPFGNYLDEESFHPFCG